MPSNKPVKRLAVITQLSYPIIYEPVDSAVGSRAAAVQREAGDELSEMRTAAR